VRNDGSIFRLILENLNDTAFLIGGDGCFEYITPNVEKTFGWAVDELIGRHFTEFIHPDDLERVMSVYSRVLEGAYDPQDFRVLRSDGSYRTIRSSSHVIRRGDSILGIAGVMVDMTDRMDIEEALRERERDLEEAQHLGRIGSWKADLATGRYTWSREYYRIIGLEPGELEADHDAYYRMIPVEDVPAHLEHVRLLFSEGTPYAAEHRLVLRNGETRWVFSRAAPVRDKGGAIVSFQGTITDITDRKLAEVSVKKNEERFREIFTYANDIIFTTDLEGTFTSMNPVIEKILGYRGEELIGRNMAAVATEESVRTAREMIVRKVGGGTGNTTYQARVRARDGNLHVLEISSTLRMRDGKPFEIFAIAREITDRIKAEEEREALEGQLRQAQKMESVGRLAGGVAHDFNNLLTGITGNVSMAISDLDPKSPVLPYLDDAKKGAESAAGLTRQLLAFSRKQIIEPRVINLNSLIENMYKMLGRLIGEDVRLEFRPGGDLWRVKTDPGQAEQVIINLAVNSRDAMPEGGRITISTRNAVLDEAYCQSHPQAAPGDFAALEISDTGTGMSGEVMSHLFEPFFTTKRKGKGTGLGLATVYGAVKQNRGHVEVASETGKGTVVTVYLPRTLEETAEERPARDAVQISTGGETILLVEDEPGVRQMAARVLARLGYRVLQSQDGESAIAAAASHEGEIRLLLTDVVMPGMNGRDLATRLKAARPGMRVLFTSGYTEDVIVDHGVLEKGISFLAKPYEPRTLASKVREVLDQ
jgi:PAS domain S-box-containing protein